MMADFSTSGDFPDSDTLLNTIAEARRLRHDDDLEGSQALLQGLLEEFPDDPLVLFEVGGSYDVMGEVEMAIPYYRRGHRRRTGGRRPPRMPDLPGQQPARGRRIRGGR